MDQTPVFFSMVPRTTLDHVGARTVNVRTSTNSTMRVTVAVTVTSSGKMLPPLVVFKGKGGGRIEREFGNFNPGAMCAVQPKAWMDKQVMKFWMDDILVPYILSAPPGVHPFLLLDSYRCHMMPRIVDGLNDVGVEVQHIPGGCTGMCQPIDVGIGKPLKSRIRNMWEDWMMEQGIHTEKFSPPPRQTIADWVVTASESLGENIVRNSWRHGQFTYFDEEIE